MRRSWLMLLLCVGWFSGTLTAQTTNCPGAPQSRLVVGEQATVSVVGGSNLRDFPAVTANLLDVVPFEARFPVLEGPYCSGGYAWWRVQYRGQRGWLAEGTDVGYWLEPYLVVQAQMATYRVETIPELATSFGLSRRENDYTFTLDGYPATDTDSPAWMRVSVRVPAIPEADEAQCVLAGDAPETCIEDELVARFLPLEAAEGFRYLTIKEDEGRVIYRMRAVRRDGSFVQLNAPLTVDFNLDDFSPPEAEDEREAYLTAYREEAADALNALDETTFTPSLALLDILAQSLRTDAPLTESNTFMFAGEQLSLTYNPYLAHTIIEEQVNHTENITHTRYVLRGYPVAGYAMVSIYDTALLDGAALAQLQQILARQPRNPPSIMPIPLLNPTSNIQEHAYLRFRNGDGLRTIITTENGDLRYHLQGLSETGDWYFSLTLPVTAQDMGYQPSLAILDALSMSLSIGDAN